MSEGWKFKDVGPSETYLVMTRVVYVIILIDRGEIYFSN